MGKGGEGEFRSLVVYNIKATFSGKNKKNIFNLSSAEFYKICVFRD